MPGTEAAFDAHASGYDSLFISSATGFLQRQRVWDYLRRRLDPAVSRDVLEINCGTGEDALWLAKRGHRVVATDLSQAMLDAASLKATTEKASIDFRKMDFTTAASHFPPGSFDVIFSDFGGLNCVDENQLRQLSEDFNLLLRPGGQFIAVIMGDNCSWEKFYFRRKGDAQKAKRRATKEAVMAEIDGQSFPVWYYAPASIREIFGKTFEHVHTQAVGWALPPSYLEPRFKNRKLLLKLLHGIENTFGSTRYAANRADHFLIAFRKKID